MTDERIYRYPDGRTQRLGASLDDVPVANATDRTAPRREVVGLSGEVFGRYGEATIVRQADGREVVTWQPEDADYTEISRVAVEKMVAEVERLRNTVAAHEAYIRGQQAERDDHGGGPMTPDTTALAAMQEDCPCSRHYLACDPPCGVWEALEGSGAKLPDPDVPMSPNKGHDLRERDAERERFAALVADLRAIDPLFPVPQRFQALSETRAYRDGASAQRDAFLAVIDRHAPDTTTEEGR